MYDGFFNFIVYLVVLRVYCSFNSRKGVGVSVLFFYSVFYRKLMDLIYFLNFIINFFFMFWKFGIFFFCVIDVISFDYMKISGKKEFYK